ncbi:MAG: glycosyltransferase family 2 protein, partial [Bacteroidales bacterium]|nr:glycosyltransferase family 2 protein [Bacteroidales bacterium]
MPFFSIIIPTYNRANMLPVALQSVLNQTFQDWECIVVDDGSDDNTRELLQQWIEKDNRFRYIYQENAERSAARNNGINNAKGDYICFLDSDDYYLKSKLQELKIFISDNNNPTAFIISSIKVEIGNEIKAIRLSQIDKSKPLDFFAQNTVFSQQTCISKQIVKQINYNSCFNIGEDFELWLRIAEKFTIIQFSEEDNTVVCDHDDRSVSLKKNNSPKEQRKTLRFCFKKGHPGHKIDKIFKRKMLADSYFNSAKHFMYNRHILSAIINIIFSILIDCKNNQIKHRMHCLYKLLQFQIP